MANSQASRREKGKRRNEIEKKTEKKAVIAHKYYHENKEKLDSRSRAWQKKHGYGTGDRRILYVKKRDEQLDMSPDDLLRSVGYKLEDDK